MVDETQAAWCPACDAARDAGGVDVFERVALGCTNSDDVMKVYYSVKVNCMPLCGGRGWWVVVEDGELKTCFVVGVLRIE